MKTKILKHIFFAASAFLLIIILFLSRNAGINCDEVLHYNHSVAVCDYFASSGSDRSALDTPGTNLKYYGQSWDNICTFLIRLLNISDVYGFRHIMSALAGWAAVFVTALFAVWLSGYGSGLIVLFLFAVSPTFIGHSLNNLKDIPFALAYIAGIFFSLKLLSSDKKIARTDILFLILSIAFSISLRAGGLLLICYLFLFFFIFRVMRYYKERNPDWNENGRLLLLLILISGAAYFLGILQWPYALQDPLRNVLESYNVMAHFPLTFRQLFEGEALWSDYMPWYFIPKSMAITIPLVVLAGIVVFFVSIKKVFLAGKALIYVLIFISLLFPLLFVILIRSNVYSSWRQFLFLYPGIILISATGFTYLAETFRRKIFKWGLIIIILLLSLHPLKFMVLDHPYEYVYFNQTLGGLAGAYGDYETDYYYTGQTEASEWLISYLKDKGVDSAVIKATYSVEWQFRDNPGIRTSYFRFSERSQHDWDYAIITNRYIPAFQLKNNTWPPDDALYNVYVEGVPVCTVLERRTRADYFGYKALVEGRLDDAILFFEEALKKNERDEMIFYNFARALNRKGEQHKADSVLMKAMELNPDFEYGLMYLGNIAALNNDQEKAVNYYSKLISVNMKYYEAYVRLSALLTDKDMQRAREVLRDCLRINPKYKPAVISLAETYRESNPDIAEKYYRLAETIE